MRIRSHFWKHTYRLILNDDGRGSARTIEFEAPGPEVALYMAQRHCRDREAELVEDGRSLGRVQCVGHGGFWLLFPASVRSIPPYVAAVPSPMPGAARPKRS